MMVKTLYSHNNNQHDMASRPSAHSFTRAHSIFSIRMKQLLNLLPKSSFLDTRVEPYPTPLYGIGHVDYE